MKAKKNQRKPKLAYANGAIAAIRPQTHDEVKEVDEIRRSSRPIKFG